MSDHKEPTTKRRKKRDKAKEKYQKFGKYVKKHIRSVENQDRSKSHDDGNKNK